MTEEILAVAALKGAVFEDQDESEQNSTFAYSLAHQAPVATN